MKIKRFGSLPLLRPLYDRMGNLRIVEMNQARLANKETGLGLKTTCVESARGSTGAHQRPRVYTSLIAHSNADGLVSQTAAYHPSIWLSGRCRGNGNVHHLVLIVHEKN